MLLVKPELIAKVNEGGVDAVKDALGQALMLEHATIPPYLYAMYSLDPAQNGVIADLIQTVVVEEMLHMTLVCNILNALGGSPVLDQPCVIPDYPGPLPGGIDDGKLIVPLAPFTLDLVKNVFMEIEEPEDPLNFPVIAAAAVPGAGPATIGAFYEAIKVQINALPEGSFSKKPRNQITPGMMPEAVVVTDAPTAIQAIDTIVEQGEGTKESPEEGVGHDFAHYYRFAEVVNGRRLIKNPKTTPKTPPKDRYVYGGDKIEFVAAGVYAVPTNPKAAQYPAGSAARQVCDTFNYTYTSLLKTLHRVFNGDPEQLGATLGLMFSLKEQAMDMMAGNTTGGQNVGPSFEYQPINP
jgi:hypothetical protein